MIKQVKECLWCSSTELTPFAKRKDGVGIVKCETCKLVMVDQVPENLDEYYYTEEYYNAGDANIDTGYGETYELMAPAFLYWQNSLVEEIDEDHHPTKFLEIGCATGNLLDMIRDFQPNVDIEGIDISKYAAGAAAAKGHKTSVGYIEEYKARQKKDIIFSSETLEHLDNLKSFLKGVSNNLADGGTFLFYVPSIEEEKAKTESEDYIRFNHNLEHLLHFTPDFFKVELQKFFKSEVLVKEFVTDFGPCIVGAVSKNKTKLNNLTKLFESLENESIPDNASNTFINNLAVLAVKFSQFKLAEDAIQRLESSKDHEKSQILILKGLYSYHQGELIKSSGYFESYIKEKPGSDFAIRSLLANEKALSKIYEAELAQTRSRANDAEVKLASIEDELNGIKNSKIGKVTINARKLAGKILNPIRNVKKKP